MNLLCERVFGANQDLMYASIYNISICLFVCLSIYLFIYLSVFLLEIQWWGGATGVRLWFQVWWKLLHLCHRRSQGARAQCKL